MASPPSRSTLGNEHDGETMGHDRGYDRFRPVHPGAAGQGCEQGHCPSPRARTGGDENAREDPDGDHGEQSAEAPLTDAFMACRTESRVWVLARITGSFGRQHHHGCSQYAGGAEMDQADQLSLLAVRTQWEVAATSSSPTAPDSGGDVDPHSGFKAAIVSSCTPVDGGVPLDFYRRGHRPGFFTDCDRFRAAHTHSARPSASARSTSRRAPTWFTTPSPPVVTDKRGRTGLAFISEVPSLVVGPVPRQHQFRLPGRRFRVHQPSERSDY